MTAASSALQVPDLRYRPAHHDHHRYDLDQFFRFDDDPVAAADLSELATLARSPHWQDRVRAEALRRANPVQLPDQFPCLYETADSPNHARLANPRPYPWVVSPDIDMLTELLPDYQELWDCHTAQWGPTSRRVFAVGRLDGLSVSALYRDGTTAAEVLVATMVRHSDMIGTAPDRLRALLEPQTAPREV